MNQYIPDEIMLPKPTDCQRCGMPKSYHKMIVNGKVYINCIRKKPYKLRDGTDVKIGMQIWHMHPWDNEYRITTGMVRFIGSSGLLFLWKYPCDRHSEIFTLEDGRTIDVGINRLGIDIHPTAYVSCFSSLENVLNFKTERIKYFQKLEKYRL